MGAFAEVQAKFARYHQSRGNVNAHIATSILGLVGFGCLVTRCVASLLPRRLEEAARFLALGLWLLYSGALFLSAPVDVAFESSCVCVFVAIASARLAWGWGTAVAAIAVAYCLQDVAHWYYGEETYQQHSWGGGGSSSSRDLFLEHCYYLVPLLLSCASREARAVATLLPALIVSWANYALDSDSRWGLPFLTTKKRLLVGKLATTREREDMAACRAWCVSRRPSETTTSHWWASDLDPRTRGAFERLVESDTIKNLFATKFRPPDYIVEPVRGMNELYVSAAVRSEGPKNSDDVFFTEHVDGPFCFFPFASVYRCIVALDDNVPGFSTHFPIASESLTARSGDVLAFDFHRESHYITKTADSSPPARDDDDYGDSKFRIVLKLHYVAAPASIFWCGRLLRYASVRYNQLFRALFLATIAPASPLSTLVADLGVVGSTKLYNAIEKYVGYANLLYYATVAALAVATRNYRVFLYATQFLHYLRYVYTYYDRDGVAFGAFKRDALVFKSVSIAQLLLLYVAAPLDSRAFGLSLLAVAAGYAVSIAATAALGVDGTYFGIELGRVEADYRFVTKFPYNLFPHPMILGQVFAILAMHFGSAALRANHPYLAPTHVSLYLIHLTQEAFDFHKGDPWYRKRPLAPAAKKAD